jgi:hypothetical protein
MLIKLIIRAQLTKVKPIIVKLTMVKLFIIVKLIIRAKLIEAKTTIVKLTMVRLIMFIFIFN